MKTRKKEYQKDFELIINKAISLLENGENRLSTTLHLSKMKYLKDFTPDISEILISDYGMSSSNEIVEKEFRKRLNELRILLGKK